MYIYTHTNFLSLCLFSIHKEDNSQNIIYPFANTIKKNPVSYNHILCLQNQSYIIYFCKNTKIVKEIPKLYTEQPYCDFQNSVDSANKSIKF